MKEPLDGSALTVKLRVRRHTENGAVASAVNRQKVLQLFAGLNGNGAALDDEFRRFHGASDFLDGGVQGREVRLAAVQQRNSHAQKDYLRIPCRPAGSV